MRSVDMVGWHKTSGYVIYEGAGTIAGGKDLLLDAKLIPEGLHVKTQNFERSIFTATDTQGFAKKGVPTLAVTTGLKSPYHKPEDDANLIDYDGMELITEHLTNVVQTVSQEDDYRASGKLAAKHSSKKFLFGVSLLAGDNYHYYTDGAINGKPADAFGAGLTTQINKGMYGLRTELNYEYLQAMHPAGKVRTHRITVPVSLVVQTSTASTVGLDVFLGGYYSYTFSGKQAKANLDFANDVYRNEGGIQVGFGIRLGQFKVSVSERYGLTNFTRHKNADNAFIRNDATFGTLSYFF
jgi:hypothetical protein